MDNIVFIGAGRAGTSFARVLQDSGKFNVTAITSVTEEQAKESANFIGNIKYYGTNIFKACDYGNIIFITTPDDIIELICNELVNKLNVQGKYFFHVSGSRASTILQKAKGKGAFIGSIHPLQSMPSFKEGSKNIKKAYFCIEGDSNAVVVAKKIVNAINGNYFTIETKYKPLYHAAAVFSSNFINSVIFVSFLIFKKLGVKDDEIIKILEPLFKGTVNNIAKLGVIDALTGPVARGDIDTIKKHLEAFEKYDISHFLLYKELTKETISLALEKDTEYNKKIKLLKDFISKT